MQFEYEHETLLLPLSHGWPSLGGKRGQPFGVGDPQSHVGVVPHTGPAHVVHAQASPLSQTQKSPSGLQAAPLKGFVV
jgi:hypothetical protein